MENYNLGTGTTLEFVCREYGQIDLKDSRLNQRAREILSTLQRTLGSCIRRLFTDKNEARQAYDFFF